MREEFITQARDRAITWARQIIENQNAVILDTETTGLGSYDQVIQIAVMGIDGRELLNQKVEPTVEISDGAYQVHGMSADSLVGCPYFTEVYPQLAEAVDERDLIIYNVQFDTRLIVQTFKAFSLTPIRGEGFGPLAVAMFHDAMGYFAEFCGEWDYRRGSFRWQKLPAGDHSAMGDCRAVLDLIKRMAATRMSTEEQVWPAPLSEDPQGATHE